MGIHGLYVDYQDNVWIAGNGDGIVQKYSHDGSTLLLQIGVRGVCDNPPAITCGNSGANPAANNSRTLLNEPPNVRVDPNPDPVTGQTGSIYVPDGYGNHRIIVFDRNGNYLRHWGGVVTAEANTIGNPNNNAHNRGSFATGDGGHPHCLVIGNDGYLYVCDRGDDRILVFDKSPKNCTVDAAGDRICEPHRIISVIPGTGVTAGKHDGQPNCVTTPNPMPPPAPPTITTCGLGTAGSAWDLDFSIDKDQRFFFEVDGGNEIVWTFDRRLALADQSTPCTTMECGTWPRSILAGFGRSGHMAGDFVFLHSIALDSRGNLFTGETINGRRIQKFLPAGDLDDGRTTAFRPSGYPDITLRHYDPRDSGGGDRDDRDRDRDDHDRDRDDHGRD